MRTRGASILVLLASLVVASSADAQDQASSRAASQPVWRDGPPVLTPPPARDPDAGVKATSAEFARWYQTMQRPTLLIFWNRQYTDEVATERASTYRETETREPGYTERTATIERQVTTGGRHADLDEGRSDDLETGFVDAFLGQGVRLVDRDTLIRKLSLQTDRAERFDMQLLETKALESGAAYLVEVLPHADAASRTGWAFTVRLKHLPTASLVGQVRTSATPAAGPSRYVATNQGYEKQRLDRVTPPLVARQLASEVMASLVRSPAPGDGSAMRP